MTDATTSHSTATAHGQNAISAENEESESLPNSASLTHQHPAEFKLPLRQSLRSSAANVMPKIHDITAKFTKACDALEVCQLVKDEYFTLFESIGAIEIMDPKMDSGFLQPGETLEDEYDCLGKLLPEELVGVMDQLLCYEMAWHTGYPLSQTLFTSVYIDKLLWPETRILEKAQFYRGECSDDRRLDPLLQVLRAYCLALIKCCDFVIAKITSRDYFEEEDFATHTYNRVLFVSIPMDVFLRELDAAVETIEDPDLEINPALRSAILSRLELRKFLLRALDPDLSLDQMPYSWSPVQDAVGTLKTTHQLGLPVPGAFSTKMQRRLASTVPPRPVVELDFKDAVNKLQELCIDCEEATRFISLPQDPLEYQSFLWYFAARSPPPLTFARSYLSSLLFHPEILQTSVSLPLTDIKTLVFASSPLLDPINWTLSPPLDPSLPKPPRVQFAMLIDEMVDRTGQPYLDFWVALGQNRCRERRLLTHVITAWDILQADASLVDQDLSTAASDLGVADALMDFSMSTWVYHKKLYMVERIVFLSFEQDIYLPDEFAGIYLFLSLTATRRKELLKRIEAHYDRRTEQLLSARQFREVQDVEAARPYLASLLAEADGIASLSLALAQFYIVLLYLDLLPVPKRPFSTESLQHELRMKPFLALSPPEAPSFEDFKAHTQPYGPYATPSPAFYRDLCEKGSDLWADIEYRLKMAKEAFTELKKLGAGAAKAQGVQSAWNKDVQNSLASCIALGVAVAGVKSAVLGQKEAEIKDVGLKVEVPESGAGKRYAENWVVVKASKK